MTYPLSIAFCAMCASAGFCFWAWLKHAEVRLLNELSAAVEQLAGKQDEMANHYGNALQKLSFAAEDVHSLAKDVSRLDSESAKQETTQDLADRLGRLEARISMEMMA